MLDYKKLLIPVILYVAVWAALLAMTAMQLHYLFAFMLLLPFLDRSWSLPRLATKTSTDIILLSICFIVLVVLLVLHPEQLEKFILILLFTALPEEWFFRAYLLERLSKAIHSETIGNIAVSIAFAALHLVMQSPVMALLVFFPSLIYGWVYQMTRNIYLVILLHAISNLVFILYLKDIF